MDGVGKGEDSQYATAGLCGGMVSEVNSSEKVTAKRLRRLIEEQGYRCALTGWKLEPDVAYVDHSTPLSRGGTHAIENLQVLHASVNTAKGTMTTQEFVEMCLAVADWHRKG
jgi:5-methylcytosine-specific restriction endonuclease McrA